MGDQVGGLSGKRVLVTGASGLVALQAAVEPAKANEVFAVAPASAHQVIGEPGK